MRKAFNIVGAAVIVTIGAVLLIGLAHGNLVLAERVRQLQARPEPPALERVCTERDACGVCTAERQCVK